LNSRRPAPLLPGPGPRSLQGAPQDQPEHIGPAGDLRHRRPESRRGYRMIMLRRRIAAFVGTGSAAQPGSGGFTPRLGTTTDPVVTRRDARLASRTCGRARPVDLKATVLWSPCEEGTGPPPVERAPGRTVSSRTGVPPSRGRPPAQPQGRQSCQPSHRRRCDVDVSTQNAMEASAQARLPSARVRERRAKPHYLIKSTP
jgi:hypothetical protein